MIGLKDIKGNVIYSSEINVGAKRKLTLMKEDYVTLPFSVSEPINIPLGAYIEIDEGRFEIVDVQKPTYKNGGYEYQLRLDASYWKWKNKIFKFTPETGGQEASWSLTASLDTHLGIFLRNLKALGYAYNGLDYEYSIDSTVENKAMSIVYDNVNMIDALSAMAESWECEWWITDNVINFGRCEYGTAVDFEIDKNVAEMSRSESQSSYATRLYVFGSTRNLPTNYRPSDESLVVNGVVQKRLMLPEGTPYIDAYEGMSEEEAIEEVVVIEDIYPKTDGTITSVETYQDTVENEDGTTTTETFYRFKDGGINFSKEYILEGEELRMKFESGSLNGMEFGVMFNPNGAAEKLSDGSWNPEAQLFEVVVNEDYGRKLPDDVLNPKVGDKYVLLNWDSTKIADLGLVSKAEKELLEEGKKISEKRKIDPSTYTCKMMPDYMYGLDDNGNQDSLFAKHYSLGDKVRLIHPAYFENGRESRIIGIEYLLDFPYDNPIYTVGETSAYSRIGELESKLESLTFKGQTYVGGGGSGVYVIGTNDSTSPTNRNVYSALRSEQMFLRKDKADRTAYDLGVKSLTIADKQVSSFVRYTDAEKPSANDSSFYSSLMTDMRIEEEMEGLGDKYLRKDKEDTAHKHITFEEGITVYQLAKMINLEVDELATIAKAIVNTLSSSTFVDGFAGEGYQIWKNIATGDWSMTLDVLTVRKMMVIYELIIQKIRSVGGMFVVSAGNGKVKEVERVGIEYKFTFEDTNTFAVNDLMRCQVFSPSGLKSYWVEVTRVEGENVYARVADFGGVVPESGDECVLMGNTKNPLRQNLILISATEDGKPRFDCLDGVKTKSFEGCLKVRVGYLDDIQDDRFPSDMQPKGYGIYGNNCYLTGVFVLSNGNDVQTQFSIMEGMIRSEISSVRAEINAKDNYLSNASFASNLELWAYDNDVKVFNTSGGLLHFNGNFYSIKNNFAGVVAKDSKNVLRIKNSFITQKNEDYNLHPSFDQYENEETGEKKYRPRMFYVSFKYMCVEGGTMKVYFKDESNDGSFESYTSINVEKWIDPNVSFTAEEFEGKWNGTGDFYLSFDGDIYIYDLALSDNALADVEEKFTTRFEQTDKRITLEAERISQNEKDIAQIKIDANSVTTRVTNVEGRTGNLEVRATNVETRVTTAEGAISRLQVEDNSIKANVSKNAEGISALEITANEIKTSVGDTNDRIDQLNEELGDTNKAVEDLDYTLDNFEDTVNDFMSDGVITMAEAIAIEKYLNSMATMMKNIETTYDKIYAHEYLENPEKRNLKTAFNALSTEYEALVDVITDVISDGLADESEKSDVSDAFSSFDNAIADYNDALQDARDAITGYFADKAVEVAEQALYDALPEDWQAADGTYASSLVQMAHGLSAVAGRFDDDGKLIEGAGWVTTSEGNTLWATKNEYNDLGERVGTAEATISNHADEIDLRVKSTDYNGNQIVSYINQTATTVTINANRVNLKGAVTYTMLDTDLQDDLDGKATSKELEEAEAALNDSILSLNTTVSGLQTDVSKKATTEALNNYVTSINQSLETKANADLTNAVVNGYTLILNGLIRTSLIDADSIVVKQLHAEDTSGNEYELNSYGFQITNKSGVTAIDVRLSGNGGYFQASNGSVWTTITPAQVQVGDSTQGVTLNYDTGIRLYGDAVISGLAVEAGTNLSNSTSFIVTDSNISLPSASSYKGRVIFVRKTNASAKITSSSTIYNGSDGTLASSAMNRVASYIFVSDGSAWYAFCCYYSS